MTDLRALIATWRERIKADLAEHASLNKSDDWEWQQALKARALKARSDRETQCADELDHALGTMKNLQAEAPNRIPFGQIVLKAQTLAKRIRSGLVEPEAVHLRSYEGMTDALVEFAVEVLELDGREARAQEEGSTREDLR